MSRQDGILRDHDGELSPPNGNGDTSGKELVDSPRLRRAFEPIRVHESIMRCIPRPECGPSHIGTCAANRRLVRRSRGTNAMIHDPNIDTETNDDSDLKS